MRSPDAEPTVTHDDRFTESSPPADGPFPATVGGFRIDRLLGRGGMGVVYAAHDPKLGRPVAVKVMRGDWLGGPVQRERFQREARAAAAVHHDHIIPVFQVGEDNGEPFLVMPLLPGRTLDARLKSGSVPLAEAIDIGRQAAEGLAAAHAAGLVHRDIKPANLFLEDRAGGGVRVRLLDFGLARSAVEETGLTSPGAVMGTPAYVAPEQAYGQPTDHRADLFSLGCVLYHLCTGVSPFAGTDPLSLRSRVDPAKLPAARVVNPAVPAELSDLTRRLMAAAPADRPATAGVVAAELAAVELAHPRRRWPLAVAAVALVAMGGLIAAQVVIRIEKNGKTAEAVVPDGSVVTVAPDGGLTVKPPGGAKPPALRGETLPPPAADFDVLLGADLGRLKEWVGGLRARGLRPDALTASGTGATERFAAVAVADRDPGVAQVALLPDAVQAEGGKLVEDGLMPTAHVATAGPAGERLTTTFWHRPAARSGNWGAFVGIDPAGLSDTHDEQTGMSRRLVRLAVVGGPDGQQAGVVYSPNLPSFSHHWRANLSRPKFDTEHTGFATDGYRLDCLDVTATAGGPAFHAIWVKDGGTSDFTLDLPRDQLDAQLAERRAARSRPYTVSAYDTPNGLRYAVTWVPMGPAEKPRDAPAPATGK